MFALLDRTNPPTTCIQMCHNMSSNRVFVNKHFSLQDHVKMRLLRIDDCFIQIPLLQVLCPWDRVVAKRLVGCILEISGMSMGELFGHGKSWCVAD